MKKTSSGKGVNRTGKQISASSSAGMKNSPYQNKWAKKK